MAERILIVDDEKIIRESLAFVMKKEGYVVDEASNGKEALKKHEQHPYDIVITDIEMPEMRGTELLNEIVKKTPQTFVIIVTAFGSLETAIEALRKGAYDYVLKPLNFEEIIYRIKKLLDHRTLSLENSLLRQELNRTYDFDNIIGQSSSMKKVFEVIQRIAGSEGTVLVTGKSGTGKELVARAIHYNGNRKQKRFVPINCAAIVETLFESELFGHKKGSFTGATMDKEGLFKVASGGTVFLDEVSEIPLTLQVKLLRAIEQKEITPVGVTEPLGVDVRIIAATNQDLRKRVEEGKFREDLFYRLNVVEIYLPSLTERQEDIPLLAQHFLNIYRKQMTKQITGFNNEAMNALLRYSWKGEVRELENAVERAVIFCDKDFIGIEHLPEHMHQTAASGFSSVPKGGHSLKEAVREFERKFIEQTLSKHDFSKEATAKALGVSLSSLYRKMEDLGIDHR
ncbi:MAG: sigma-54-dependent Fis family transcriptional regulator [Ignavibacteriales bacterium]|nr:sigma-54-dependent Fis family transcriptional regulator [Ignavibacteriales bacterium]